MEIIAFLRAFRFAEASENSIFDCSVPFLVSERRHFVCRIRKISREIVK